MVRRYIEEYGSLEKRPGDGFPPYLQVQLLRSLPTAFSFPWWPKGKKSLLPFLVEAFFSGPAAYLRIARTQYVSGQVLIFVTP